MALGALQSIEAAGFNNEGTDSEQYIPIIGIDALQKFLTELKVRNGRLCIAKTQEPKVK